MKNQKPNCILLRIWPWISGTAASWKRTAINRVSRAAPPSWEAAAVTTRGQEDTEGLGGSPLRRASITPSRCSPRPARSLPSRLAPSGYSPSAHPGRPWPVQARRKEMELRPFSLIAKGCRPSPDTLMGSRVLWWAKQALTSEPNLRRGGGRDFFRNCALGASAAVAPPRS